MATRPMAPVPAITTMWRISEPVIKRGAMGWARGGAEGDVGVLMAGWVSGVCEVDTGQLPQHGRQRIHLIR